MLLTSAVVGTPMTFAIDCAPVENAALVAPMPACVWTALVPLTGASAIALVKVTSLLFATLL